MRPKKYDYLIVGSGLFGSVFGREMHLAGKNVLIIDKREHIGGNVYTEKQDGIIVHRYGPHLFHTNNKIIWDYIRQFGEFNSYQHRVRAIYKDKLYSLPFNMNTFNQLWGVTFPAEAKAEIDRQRLDIKEPSNLEEWALSQVGPDVYHTLIYGYTKKHWGRDPKLLPTFVAKRLPIRFTYDDNYFDDEYQGVPIKGYTHIIENMLDGLEVRTHCDFFDTKDWRQVARKLVYTGPLDEFFKFKYGELDYRSLVFDHKNVLGNCQGIGQMNYTDIEVSHTRVVEHIHFRTHDTDRSIMTYEYPEEWVRGKERYYPVHTDDSVRRHQQYLEEAKKTSNMIVGGRLSEFRYYNMDEVINAGLLKSKQELNGKMSVCNHQAISGTRISRTK